jgi:hypothetical protein
VTIRLRAPGTSATGGASGGQGEFLPRRSPGGLFSTLSWDPSRRRIRRYRDTLYTFTARTLPELDEQWAAIGNSFTTFSTSALPTIGQGPTGISYKIATEQLTLPVLGLMPTDEFTVEFSARSSVAFSALTQFAPLFTIGDAYIQKLVFVRSGGSLVATLFGPTGGQANPGVSVSDVEWPADTWVHLAVVYSAALGTMKLYFGDGTKNASASAAGIVLRPWGNGSRRDHRRGFQIEPNGVEIGDLMVHRYARLLGANSTPKALPSVTIDCDAEGAAFPYRLCGFVDHTTNWNRFTTLNAFDEAQVDAAASNGCRFARMTEHNDRAILGSGGVIDFSLYDAYSTKFYSRGLRALQGLGYVPGELGGGGLGADPPSNFDACAEYFADVVDHTLDDLAAPVDYWSFGNEPEQPFFWSGTDEQFIDLYIRTYQEIRTRRPGFVLGGIDGADATFRDLMLTAIAAAGLPLGPQFIHNYDSNVISILAQADAYRAAAVSHGLTASPIVLSEWSHAGADTKDTSHYAISERDIYVRPFAGAWVHHAIKAMADYGNIAAATYFRLGQQIGDDAEQAYGMLARDNTPTPLWAAFTMLWQHAGNRLTATSNWPTHNVLASRAAGKIVVTYDAVRADRQDPRFTESFHLDWRDLPAAFTWEHFQMDGRNPSGIPTKVGAGDQSSLPSKVTIGSVGVGMFRLRF